MIKIFIKILERSVGELEYDCDFHKRQVSIDVKKAHLDHVRFFVKEKIGSTVGELKKTIIALQDAIKDLQSTTENPNSYWSRVAHTSIMTWKQIVNGDSNSDFPIFMEQKQISQNQDASVHNVGQSVNPSRTTPATIQNKPIHQVSEPFMTGPTGPLEDPSTTNESPQRTSAKKKVMYGFMIAFPPLAAVGIYSGLVGTAAFDPVIATGIFIGVAVIALALFVTVKKVCDKQSGSGMDTPPSKANLSSLSSLNLRKERNIQEISAI